MTRVEAWLVACWVLLATNLAAAELDRAALAQRIEAVLRDPEYAAAYWGIEVRSLATGERVYGHNADRSLQPASTLKLVTTAAAIEGAVTAEDSVKARTAVVRNHLGVVQTYRFAIVDPLEWHSCNVGSKNLLRDVLCKSCEHSQLRSLRPHYYSIYKAFKTSSSVAFASPNNMRVLSRKNSGFCTPA